MAEFRPAGQKILPRTDGSLPTSRDLARMVGFWPTGQILVVLVGFWPVGRSPTVLCQILIVLAEIRSLLPESGHFHRNPANLDSDKIFRILAFISDSGYSSRNPVKVAWILSVSNGISSPVIFILFYINIYMFRIKIGFYRLIWLNKNIKKLCDFPYMPNTEKCFRWKIFFRKMTSLKPFYVETNGA
jgi:hypothetical protein